MNLIQKELIAYYFFSTNSIVLCEESLTNYLVFRVLTLGPSSLYKNATLIEKTVNKKH
ncbi:19623_t:CDS:2 [Gigaspora margarita]|uniref:19623_t:CDS:1 n=1 Tax=Gigaspora margarita TaxID=4874 RepID=A0ABM8W338_GIGMA|nr:19623_t:CDS:2 [Gigaspora margarita]